jgi:uncharacterized protein (DUF427 family)
MKAIWNNQVIAESDDTIIIEGNHYFPVESMNPKFLKPSETQTECHWKGTASYYNIDVKGEVNQDAAWYYPKPSNLAEGIKDHVAFWRGVEITK